MAKCGAVASINQTGTGIRLPNFCNLGVMLRCLLLVNALLAVAAVIRAPSANTIWLEFLVIAAFGEPVLIASLLALCAARRFLNAIGYVGAIALLAIFELGITWLLFEGSTNFMPIPGNMTFGQVVFVTFFVTAVTLGYFDLRARALSPAVAEARIQALQARIRPHFLYNSINAVLSLIRTEPRRAERALEDLADLFRVLMAENRTLAPIAGEVELARQYLALESLRLGERLRVTWHTETMPGDAMVPPLILQPLVENAVYHGIEPSEAGGEIVIVVAREAERVRMELTNPLPGATKRTAGNRMAINNIRERLQLHYDAEASMSSEVRDGRYHVTIRVPYLTAGA